MDYREIDILKRFIGMLNPIRMRVTSASHDGEAWFTPYDSDYARLVFSAPVRRLQDKTQVFPSNSIDFARTRLTHSMEVAAFARSMGYAVESMLAYRLTSLDANVVQLHWIPKILEAASLVHDIGNPPYGHQGEKAIRDFFRAIPNSDLPKEVKDAFANLPPQQQADLCNFDGNVQGFRILTKLGLAPDDYSFNLTFPVLATLVKYPFSSIEGCQKTDNHEQSKFGFFDSEKTVYERIVRSLHIPTNSRHPLTYLLEAADDIAYNVCDVEDGVHMSIISVQQIKDIFRENKLEEWLNGLNLGNIDDDLFVQRLRIAIQTKMIRDCEQVFMEHFEDFVLGTAKIELLKASKSSNLLEAMKQLGKNNFSDEKVRKAEEYGKIAIQALLKIYLCALFSPQRSQKDTFENMVFNEMSENYWKVAIRKAVQGNDPYSLFQYAVDQVSGMTDKYLLSQYEKYSQK